MRLLCENGRKSINIGSGDIWKAVYSTVLCCLGKERNEFEMAYEFFKTGKCKGTTGYQVARQINLIRDELSQFPPEMAVYDIDNPNRKAPWTDDLSPVITSCSNLFTTADGGDLFFEIVSILCYAQIAKTDVFME